MEEKENKGLRIRGKRARGGEDKKGRRGTGMDSGRRRDGERPGEVKERAIENGERRGVRRQI